VKRALLLVLLAACGGSRTGPAAPTPTAARAPAAKIEFIEDDYARALDLARAKNLPLFVDAWAPWCHSCLSMRAFVFPDPLVVAKKDEFVWLSLDTEKDTSAAFLKTHPMEFWPTLWVIDPKTETPLLRWGGTTTAPELVTLLDDVKGGLAGDAAAAYLRGNQESAKGNIDAAILAYRAALAAAPPGWPRRSRAVEALSSRLRAKKDCTSQIALAINELPQISAGTSAKAVAQDALLCLVAVPDRPHKEEVLVLAEKIARDPTQPLLADDRSDLYAEICGTLHELGDVAGAKRVAQPWAAFLEAEAAHAKTPEARAVFDPQRYEAYLVLDEPARAVPMLEQSEKDFPRDYNPPARLAASYFHMKKYDDALKAIDRALALAYGPRQLRLYTLKADIYAAKGERALERATAKEALAKTKGLVLMGSALRARDALEKRVNALTTP
jgi:tetratricopeptide (TPR) repeat protein